jgi:hypothetical protein
MVSGNMPAFSAYLSADQTVTSGVLTKVAYDTESFDTANCFSSSRFTPNVAGYYQVNTTIAGQASTALTIILGQIYKNGSSFTYGLLNFNTGGNARYTMTDLIYMNGTTDYLEVYARADGTGTVSFSSGINVSKFSACLVRTA